MLKKMQIFIFLLLFAASISAQTIVTETTRIDAQGLKALKPNATNRKPVLLNFWATWCGPCHSEFPELIKIDKDFRKRGLAFNLVSVDNFGLIDSSVPEFLRQYESTMPSFLIDLPNRKAIAKAVKTIAPAFRDVYPFTVLFDKNGRIVFQKLGKIDPKILRANIEKTLRK